MTAMAPSVDGLHLSLSDLHDYEAGAALLALLAYPADRTARARFDKALRYKAVADHLALDREWANSQQMVRPADLLHDPHLAAKYLTTGCRIISNERLIAAKMAAPSFAARLRDEGVDLPVRDSASVTEMARRVTIDLDARRKKDHKPAEGNDKNVLSRAWTPSKPVLHIALGLHIVIHHHSPMANSEGLNVGDILFDIDLTLKVISLAQFILPRLPNLFEIPATSIAHIVVD